MEIKSFNIFFKWPKYWTETISLLRPFSPKVVRSKFWDSHFVQYSWKVQYPCLWGWHDPTEPPEEGPQVMKFNHCMYILLFLRSTPILFRGDFLGIDFSWGKFPIGMEVSGVELSRNNFTRRKFSRIPMRNFHVEMLWGIIQDKFYIGELSPGEIFLGEIFHGKNFSLGGGG